MFALFIKYKEAINKILKVPFNTAFINGRKCVKVGTTAGAGMICLFKIKTTAKTKIDMAATNRNINLSVIIKVNKYI